MKVVVHVDEAKVEVAGPRGQGYIGTGGPRPCTFSNDERHCAASLVRSPLVANQAERSTHLPIRTNDVIPTPLHRPVQMSLPAPNRPDRSLLNRTGSSLRLGAHTPLAAVTSVVCTFDRHACPTPPARRPPFRSPHILRGVLHPSRSHTRGTIQGRCRPAGPELPDDMDY